MGGRRQGLAAAALAAGILLAGCAGEGSSARLNATGAPEASSDAPSTTVAPTAAETGTEPAADTTGPTTTVKAQATQRALAASTQEPVTTTIATTVTTAATTATTTAPANVTTTTAPAAVTTTTTAPLETVPALSLGTTPPVKGACAGYFDKAVPLGVDVAKLNADLATHGYQLPKTAQFRDRNGAAVTAADTRQVDQVQKQFDQCASDNGGKPGRPSVYPVAGNEGSQLFAQLLVAQFDAMGLKNYAGIGIA